VSVTEGVTLIAAFANDGKRRRVQKLAGGVTRDYIFDGPTMIEERVSGGVVRYFYGLQLDQWLGRQNVDASQTYFVADHLGSVVAETNASGQITVARIYDPWGNLDITSAAVRYDPRDQQANRCGRDFARKFPDRSCRLLCKDVR
jgi:uncharacterized protein RhaS with RHS repeats